MILLFEEVDVQYAFDSVADFILGSGSSSASAHNGTGLILSLLQRYGTKVLQFNADPKGTDLPRALYTAEQLQSYIRGEPCAIDSSIGAEVFLNSLGMDVMTLKRLEPEIPNGGIHLVTRNKRPN
ncbi:MAG: hypothetical protein H0X25_04855 [Acidobacteriales bacterium]|nr:hypothetical protein [Terriglobales bacterium]